jgi:hypothetical protein
MSTGHSIGDQAPLSACIAEGGRLLQALAAAKLHPHYAATVAQLFADHPSVDLCAGDWHGVMRTAGPFNVLCMDATLQVDL